MVKENSTMVTEFILLGLTQSQEAQLLVFVLVLIFYLIILPGNFLIILTIRSDPGLTAPLYFFLGNLAFLDASYSFIVAPRMLVDFLSEKKKTRKWILSYGHQKEMQLCQHCEFIPVRLHQTSGLKILDWFKMAD
ncbi:olfactory receptor 4N5 isoform X2 [Balaenoptera acutorostrata]|uniref:Olfactory receptor 4N5 isoform X2 n=1 Tax=Balaenoptera acutorostrata TaxID=9767 RepID=A0ABM3TCR6_BALAC|nr:olfactory receptor 4N5 isoform X2 [Balaenoptera acutorostrata]